MTDYIRREDALRAVQRQRGANRSPAQNEMLNRIKADISRAPAADVAPVVRCKKCLYRSQYANEDGFYQCGMIQCADEHCALVPPNFACIAGVRRGKKMDGGNENE